MAYIDRELMFKKIRGSATTKFDWSEQIDVDDFETVIKELPIADVEEVKHGEWIKKVVEKHGIHRPILICSKCNKRRFVLADYNFCPNCGAKMDGGKTE